MTGRVLGRHADAERIIRRVYPTRGWRGVHAELPFMRKSQISGMANRLGIRKAGKPVPDLTPEREAAIRAMFAAHPTPGVKRARELSRAIGYPAEMILLFGRQNGLSVPAPNAARWSEAERRIVRALAHRPAQETVDALAAAGFRRSKQGVINARYSFRLGASPDGVRSFSIAQLADLIGCDVTTIQRAITAGRLRATVAVAGEGGRVKAHRINIADALEWAEKRAATRLRNKILRRVRGLQDLLDYGP